MSRKEGEGGLQFLVEYAANIRRGYSVSAAYFVAASFMTAKQCESNALFTSQFALWVLSTPALLFFLFIVAVGRGELEAVQERKESIRSFRVLLVAVVLYSVSVSCEIHEMSIKFRFGLRTILVEIVSQIVVLIR